MNDILKNLASKAQSKNRDFTLLAQKVKNLQPQRADEIFGQLNDEAFKHISCLDCGNCCKGLGPEIYLTDVRRMARHLKMKAADFIDTYLEMDIENVYIFKSLPCPFLAEDNYCMVYPARPKACREYPHTDQKNIRSILTICVKNTKICPAVFYIFERLPAFVGKK